MNASIENPSLVAIQEDDEVISDHGINKSQSPNSSFNLNSSSQNHNKINYERNTYSSINKINQDIRKEFKELQTAESRKNQIYVYLEDFNDKIGSTMDHMRVFIDKRYQIMTNMMINVQKKLQDYVKRTKKIELRMEGDRAIQHYQECMSRYREFSEILQRDMQEFDIKIHQEHEVLDQLSEVLAKSKEILHNKNSQNLKISAQINQLKKDIQYYSELNKQQGKVIVYRQNQFELIQDPSLKIDSFCGSYHKQRQHNIESQQKQHEEFLNSNEKDLFIKTKSLKIKCSSYSKDRTAMRITQSTLRNTLQNFTAIDWKKNYGEFENRIYTSNQQNAQRKQQGQQEQQQQQFEDIPEQQNYQVGIKLQNNNKLLDQFHYEFQNIANQIVNLRIKNLSNKNLILLKTNKFVQSLRLFDDCMKESTDYLEKSQKKVNNSADGLTGKSLNINNYQGSLLFELKKTKNFLSSNSILQKQKIKKTNLMNREISSLVHDTLRGMLDRKIKQKNKKEEIQVDFETFKTFSTVQLVGLMVLKPQSFSMIRSIFDKKQKDVLKSMEKFKHILSTID